MSETKVVLPEAARISYPALMKPRETENGDLKYQATLLIPKENKASVAALQAGIKAALEKGISSKWGGKQPAKLRMPLLDGDGTTPSGEPWGEECKGHWVLRSSANEDYPPRVFDNTEGNRELKGEEIRKVFAGCYVSATVNFFPYDAAGNKGIGTGLTGILFLRDGEPFAGPTATAEDFATFAPTFPVASDDPLAAMLGG